MIVVDTSAWVEYDRATGSPLERPLTDLIETGGDIAPTDPELMEILAGARSDEAASSLRRLLTSFGWIPTLDPTDYEGAARIHRECRQRGLEPGGMIDCMIANLTIRTGSSPLTGDVGFVAMAQVVSLALETIDR